MIDCWLFDLDQTLYPASSRLFDQVSRRMGDYVAASLGIGADEARAIQKRYYLDHGTTLSGMMLHHGTDPRHYLDYVHDIDLSGLRPAPRLAELIAALPGRKIVFTNADTAYAERVLTARGLNGLFETIHDIEASGWHPKPHEQSYRTLAHAVGLDPVRAAYFEDLAINLAPAKHRGMTTIWIDEPGDATSTLATPDYVDYRTPDLERWLENWQRGAITDQYSEQEIL